MKKKIKWIVMLALCLGMLFHGEASAAGSTMDTAQAISFGSSFGGTLGKNTEDYYKFTLPSSGRILITGSAQVGYGWYLNIYDEQRKETSWRKLEKDSIGETIDLTKGTYYLCLSDGEGDYTMQMSFTDAGESFGETGRGTNNSLFDADNISLNRIYKGQMACNDLLDFYKFTLSSASKISIQMSAADGHQNVTLCGIIYDERGNKLFETYHNNSEYELQKGTYYFVIDGNEFYTGNYTFKIAAHNHAYKDIVTKAKPKKNGKIVRKCSCGVTAGTTTIYAPTTLSLSTARYTYNGKVKKPAVRVTDTKGKAISASNYTVSYSKGRKDVGRYTVKVAFKGSRYSGSLSKTFDIAPKAVTVSKAAGSTRGFSVRWSKNTRQTTGYQVQYSTDRKFKKGCKAVTIGKNRTTFRKISKLKAKKRYYVRVRTYKNVRSGGKTVKIYSGWSKARAVKTK